MASASFCLAGDNNGFNMTSLVQTSENPVYHEQEFNLSVFGSGEYGRGTGKGVDNDFFGVGLEGQCFLKQIGPVQLGASASAWLNDATHIQGSFVDNARVTLVGRIPIGISGVALFGEAGEGYDFEVTRLRYEYAGGGVEFRSRYNWSFYLSMGFNWSIGNEDFDSYPSSRAGFRFVF